MREETLTPEQVGERFVEGLNRRDAEQLVALSHPQIELLPALLVGPRAVYRGHDGIRDWIDELVAAEFLHQRRVRKVRPLGDERVAVITEVAIDGEVLSPSATVLTLEDGLVRRAKTYLSDEATLVRVGVLPPAGR